MPTDRQRALQIARRLRRDYPDATCALHFDNPLQLLIATILSAQCTDERVNAVTPELFRRFRSAADYARAPRKELEDLIRPTGFFRNKAQSIQACCQQLVDQHQGQVPKTLEDLVQLPGVGRKTGNVVLGTAYGLASGIVVDTHVKRISRRLGLTTHQDPVKIEADLMRVLPPREWIDFSHRLIHHGRRVCRARKPDCEHCGLRDVCPQLGVS